MEMSPKADCCKRSISQEEDKSSPPEMLLWDIDWVEQMEIVKVVAKADSTVDSKAVSTVTKWVVCSAVATEVQKAAHLAGWTVDLTETTASMTVASTVAMMVAWTDSTAEMMVE